MQPCELHKPDSCWLAQSLKASSELAEAKAESLTRQLAESARELEQSAADRASVEARLAAAQIAKPAVVPLSEASLSAMLAVA